MPVVLCLCKDDMDSVTEQSQFMDERRLIVHLPIVQCVISHHQHRVSYLFFAFKTCIIRLKLTQHRMANAVAKKAHIGRATLPAKDHAPHIPRERNIL